MTEITLQIMAMYGVLYALLGIVGGYVCYTMLKLRKFIKEEEKKEKKESK